MDFLKPPAPEEPVEVPEGASRTHLNAVDCVVDAQEEPPEPIDEEEYKWLVMQIKINRAFYKLFL